MEHTIDTELSQLQISDTLRKNASFMKIMAALFYHGNQPMSAAQLVVAVRNMNLLALKRNHCSSRGETPKSTVQGIISFSRKTARKLDEEDPFDIDKDESGRWVTYRIASTVLNGTTLPDIKCIPQEPVTAQPSSDSSDPMDEDEKEEGGELELRSKRQRRTPVFYSPETTVRTDRRRTRSNKPRTKSILRKLPADKEPTVEKLPEVVDETILSWTLDSCPPEYPGCIEPVCGKYGIAARFAASQQTGYSYPRLRSQEKIKIKKLHCEDKFKVSEILLPTNTHVSVGRMFILADGHGGHGCAEFFVEKTPLAVQRLCDRYSPENFESKDIQLSFQRDIKQMVGSLDEEYLRLKRKQLQHNAQVDNDGCTLIINIFFGDWMINVNVGDSRTVLMERPLVERDLQSSSDLAMEVVFASQDHKPYLEYLAREIIEHGGEFVDAVQNKVIKVDFDSLKDEYNRTARRTSLKNARIRPRDHPGIIQCDPFPEPKKSKNPFEKIRSREAKVPSLNVARSCGDLDFKMDDASKIISCEPDVTFVRVAHNGIREKRTFLFMSTDGIFDYMYEKAANLQNKAIARILGSLLNSTVTNESLLYTTRFFANRESRHTFYDSTLQDYDDCTVILIEV
ncbi:phosphatase 2C-like domain-containing protein [Phycomyces nitens]|nr:phosphatase 2C-like domain-containing protein [Phycomyces nitens]